MDDLDKPFVDYVEKPFRDRGLRTAVLMLPNVSPTAMIKRQAREGVHAVVKLYRRAREIGRIPVLIFDRSNPANVRFEGPFGNHSPFPSMCKAPLTDSRIWR